MNKKSIFFPKSFFLAGLFLALPVLQSDAFATGKKGLFSSSSRDLSGTAGVRGGDVMGDAIKEAAPNPNAVRAMEARRVPTAQLESFQRQGKVGHFARGGS